MRIPDNIYHKIVRLLPIPCVDLLITNRTDEVLMLKRKNPPAKNQWWFPGGRVFWGELRIDAANRKLKEECGLEATEVRMLGTYDLIFEDTPIKYASHGITTVFHMVVDQSDIHLDEQSIDYSWKSVDHWVKKINNEFLISVLHHLSSLEPKLGRFIENET
jgi:colanic acid biosynthesis protein WcaH